MRDELQNYFLFITTQIVSIKKNIQGVQHIFIEN